MRDKQTGVRSPQRFGFRAFPLRPSRLFLLAETAAKAIARLD